MIYRRGTSVICTVIAQDNIPGTAAAAVPLSFVPWLVLRIVHSTQCTHLPFVGFVGDLVHYRCPVQYVKTPPEVT